MKLYEIKEAYMTLDRFIEDNELSREDFKQAFDEIEGAIEEKIENTIKYMKNIQGDIEKFKVEEKRLSERRKAMENFVENTKKRIDEVMTELKLKELKAGTFSLKYQKNKKAVNIVDTNLIPRNYVVSTEVKVDKAAILQDIENGVEVPGVEITQSESLRIR